MTQGKRSCLGTAVVTGASSGIGKVYAARLAERGYDLLLVARRKDRLDAIADDLQSRFFVQVQVVEADLAQPGDLAKVSEQIAADETITMLVNNAGTSNFQPVAQVGVETLTNMIALNVTALTLLTRAVLQGFTRRNAGTIINIGSVVGFSGYPSVAAYGGTKAYVLNFSQALKQQLADTAIRVQCVAPSATSSEIWDVVGVPASALGENLVMDTDTCVDAALKGLDDGEFITVPSLSDATLLSKFEEAGTTLMAATQTDKPAPRYV